MFWSTKKPGRKKSAAGFKRRGDRQRGLRLESLEGRRLLAGLVTITTPVTAAAAPVPAMTGLTLTGDADNNSVTIESTGAGSYMIVGTNGTLLSNDGGVTTVRQLPVNGISGLVTVDLGAGSDSFAVAADRFFSVPTSLTIMDSGFGDSTNLARTMVPQNLTFMPVVGAPSMGAVNVLAGLNISGDLSVTNGVGTTTTLGGDADGDASAVTGNVAITNLGSNVNTVRQLTVNGDLLVSKGAGIGGGTSNLTIHSTTVVGSTIVNNVSNPGGSGGTSMTSIVNSTLMGMTTSADAPALPIGFMLHNSNGSDMLSVTGATTIGPAVGVNIAAPPVLPNAFMVTNGLGGSMVTFGGVDAADLSRVKINGNLSISNGANLPDVVDMASFDQTDVLGSFNILNAGGPGATSTMITDSNLGTFLAPAGPGAGSPVMIANDDGQDSFMMNNSTAPWGLFINNDDAGGGATPWGSSTVISNSSIGMRMGGPAAPPAFPVAGSLSPAGTGLGIYGGNGIDTVRIEGAQMRIGGIVDMILPGGNNVVEIFGSADAVPMIQSLMIVTSGNFAGNDTVTLRDVAITTSVNIALGTGSDLVQLQGATTLPANGVGIVNVDGGAGLLDRFEIAESVMLAMALPPGALPFGFINFG